MKNKTDLELINLVKDEQDSNSLLELSERYKKIYLKYISIFSKKNEKFSYLDASEDVNYVIYHAILSYKPNKKVKFSTWLHNCSRYYCLNSITKSKRKFKLLSYTNDVQMEHKDIDYLNNKKNNYIHFNNNETKDYFHGLFNQMNDKRILKIYNLRFSDDGRKVAWNKVAKKMNLSITMVINIWSKANKFLKTKLKNQEVNDKI